MIRSIAERIRHQLRMIRKGQCFHCCLICEYWDMCKCEEAAEREEERR